MFRYRAGSNTTAATKSPYVGFTQESGGVDGFEWEFCFGWVRVGCGFPSGTNSERLEV
jgi:hypothetical protein